ncbi:hypothetical protein RO3G_13583 [Lichtheimia corymbifera JMRC:FSU:9682]|uniref:F-box domain-containing protein n=1 Tax=Lichtheimia corymbifera JMRC:FSU:9682 TaxID=1263082 RepID=A0A068S800_9FUNG|nr:hypothetical protein RO3G_13583 [Lichtheimia corymbifera JMRC:FSU:9682]
MSHDFQSSTSILLTNDDQQQLEQLQQQQPPLDTTQYGSNNNTPSKPTDKRKGKQAFDPNAPCYIQQLSIEVLAHVFARLDPTSLATVGGVCRFWRHIVMDDTCWKDAFLAYFDTLPFKRLRKDSWKSEYILRTHLIRRWEKGRGTVIQFNPKVGSIKGLAVDYENSTMLVASAEQGLGVRCNPTTGKVERHLMYSTNDNVPCPVRTVEMDGQRILWGFHPGFITMSMRGKSAGGRQLRVFSDFHQGAVTALALSTSLREVVLSAGEDGAIKIWDVITGTCAKSMIGVMATPTCLEITKDFRVIAGYASGDIVVWDIHVGQIAKERRDEMLRRQHLHAQATTTSTTTTDLSTRRHVISPKTVDTGTAVQTIKHDADLDVMLVTYAGSHEVWKYSIKTGECLAVYGGDKGHIGTITCMEWDTTLPGETVPLQNALKVKKSGVTNGTSSKQQHTPISSPVKTMRVMVTGDAEGTVCVWDGDAVQKDGKPIAPLRVLQGHICPISAIHVDGCKIVSGSDDGWIRFWDPLTGNLLNVLGNKIPRNAPVDRTDVSMMRVTNIHCDEYRGVATIGHQVKSWDFSPDKQFLDKRNLRQKGKVGNGNARQLHYEMKQDLRESAEAIKQERFEREQHAKEVHKMSLGGLSDEEMLAYAMMLSQEEQGATKDKPVITNADYVDEEDEALMQAMMESLRMEEEAKAAREQTITPPAASSSGSSELDHWPMLGEGSGASSSGSSSRAEIMADADDAYDAELQYVLQLSQKEM